MAIDCIALARIPTAAWSMPVAAQNRIIRSSALSLVVAFMTYCRGSLLTVVCKRVWIKKVGPVTYSYVNDFGVAEHCKKPQGQKSRGFQGEVIRISRNQGALDGPDTIPKHKSGKARSRKRPDSPRIDSRTESAHDFVG